MTTTATPIAAPSISRKLLRMLPWLALLLAIAAVTLLVLGPLGWRAGWWHFRVAFQSLMPWAGYCGLAAVVVAALSLVLGARTNTSRNVAIGVLAFLVGGGIAYVPWHYDQMRGTAPPIHDITTDWEIPPQYQAILPLRQAENANPVAYEGAKVSELQRKAYPDIAPLTVNLGPAETFTRALKAAEQQGWTIVATDPAAGRIEASQRSRWFGFTDDVVVRIAAAANGSRVDVRSVSRVGRSDFGVNAARIGTYLAALRDATK